MALRLCKIEITLSLQSISKEVHGRAARRVKTYGIPMKLRILPRDVRSENGPFRPDTYEATCDETSQVNRSYVNPRLTEVLAERH